MDVCAGQFGEPDVALDDQLFTKRGKEGLVADQEFDRAAALRDLERRLKKYRDKFINEWPKSGVKEA